MKIALVANAYPPFFIGGAEIAAHRQARELLARGHELSCFCAASDEALRPYSVTLEEVDGVEVTRVNVPATRFTPHENFVNVLVEARFRDFISRQEPDVVHFHNLPGLSLSLFDVCEELALPSMVTFHDHWGFCLRNTLIRPGESRVCPDWSECHVCLDRADFLGLRLPTFMRTDYIRAKLHKASLFHFPSRYLLEAYGAAAFDSGRAVQHTYGIEPGWFAEPPASAGPATGDVLRVVFVGYLGRHKGPDTLMAAIDLIAREGLLDRFRFDIHGRGELQAQMEALITRQAWGEHVRLLGQTDNAGMSAVYREADLMVNCSRWPENEPLTLLESLASGTPVAATRIGGNIELVQEGVNGWLYSPGSAEELAAILRGAAADPAALASMRPAARASVASRTISAYADFALDAYARLQLPSAAMLPSTVAVFGANLVDLDGPALRRVSRTGFWGEVEWLPAEAIRGRSEMEAVVVALSCDGRLDAEIAGLLPSTLPVVVLGSPKDPAFRRFSNVRSVPDLEALAELGSLARGTGLPPAKAAAHA